MKMLTTSLVLACANVLLIGMLFLGRWTHIRGLENLPGVISLVVVPSLVLATLGFAITDLVHPGSRWQGILALVLSVPIGVMYSMRSF